MMFNRRSCLPVLSLRMQPNCSDPKPLTKQSTPFLHTNQSQLVVVSHRLRLKNAPTVNALWQVKSMSVPLILQKKIARQKFRLRWCSEFSFWLYCFPLYAYFSQVKPLWCDRSWSVVHHPEILLLSGLEPVFLLTSCSWLFDFNSKQRLCSHVGFVRVFECQTAPKQVMEPAAFKF